MPWFDKRTKGEKSLRRESQRVSISQSLSVLHIQMNVIGSNYTIYFFLLHNVTMSPVHRPSHKRKEKDLRNVYKDIYSLSCENDEVEMN